MSEDNKKSLTQQLDELFAPHCSASAPGVVVGVARQGKLLYRRALGLASVEHGVANSPATRMRIGSTSKQFTCLAALLLAEEGKLDLDATVDVYDPDMPELLGYPTLRQLMNHTSGYRDTQEIAFNAAGLSIQPAGKIMQAMHAQSSAIFAPGEGQLYCNAAYYLLSDIIAQVSGLSFAEFLKQRIFEPLGMHNSELLLDDMRIIPQMATMHLPRPDGGWRRGLMVNEETSGCGGIISTVDDLLKWAAHLRDPQVLGSAESWAAMLAPTRLNSGVEVGYGLGIYHHDYRGVDIIHHAGGVIGGNSQLLVVPDEDLDIVVLSNTDGIASAGLAMQILELLLPERLQAPTVPAASAGFEHLFGTRYRHERGLVFGFDDVGGMLGISAQLSPCAPVLRDEGDSLRARWEDIGMGPFDFPKKALAATDGGQAPDTLEIRDGGYPRRLTRMADDTPSLACLADDLSGEYHCADMDTTATISFDGEALLMRYTGGYGVREMALDAVSADVLGVTWLDPVAPVRYPLTLLREDGNIVGFLICNTRSRDMRFTRLPKRIATPE